MTMHTRFRWLVFVVGLCVLPRASEAQLAPTGAHYGARSTDTGFSGADAGGGYSTSIPLDLPPARGGLPLPVQIVSGTRAYGAFGLGWDLPISVVHIDRSIAHRRPGGAPNRPISDRQRVTVSLPGRSSEMVFRQSTQSWIGRQAPDLELREESGRWILYDGSGLTYIFRQPASLSTTGGPSNRPGTSGLWLLSEIRGPGNTAMKIDYDVRSMPMPGPGAPPAVLVNLVKVSYDQHPSSSCFKHEITLAYDWTDADVIPKSLAVFGSTLLVRNSKVVELASSSRATCSASLERLRKYRFHYDQDQDTRLARLTSVDVSGRETSTEANTIMPVASYGYGSATTTVNAAPALTYSSNSALTVQFPKKAKRGITSLLSFANLPFQSPSTEAPHPSATLQNLIDMTGDGRPDLIFEDAGRLQIARNVAGPNGRTTFAPPVILNDATFTRPFLDARTSKFDRHQGPEDSQYNVELVWTQTIDVNGDGRLDIVDASEMQGYWSVYLNTPDAAAASGIKWERRPLYVGKLIAALRARGQYFGWDLASGYLPLSRRVSGRDYERATCWLWSGDRYVSHPIMLHDPD